MNACIIPARGGSKRIPKKNIRDFCGKPMIVWPIEAARQSGLFDSIFVSTDDLEIAAVAKRYGAEVPFLRPSSLADDYVPTTAVVAHGCRWALEQGWQLDALCCIYATSPFVQSDDLKLGFDTLYSGAWDYAFSVTDFAAPVFRAFRELPDGGVEMFFPEYSGTRSQDLPVALHDAGQFYWGRPSAWTEGNPIFGRLSVPVRIPRWRVQDIDTEEDWKHAELMFRALEEQSHA